MDNKDRQDLIDRYIINTLTAEERIAFEKQLASDIDLQKEVELTRLIASALQREGEENIFNILKSMPGDEFNHWINSKRPIQSNKKRLLFLSLPAAAVIFLLLFIGLGHRYSTTDLFNQYYTVPAYETYFSRGGSNLTNDERSLIQQAKERYQRSDYRNALQLYNQIIEGKTDWKQEAPEEVIFYSAICRLETNDLPGAIDMLEYVASVDTSDFQDDAAWNLAFAYLKDGRRNEASESLERLIKKESEYAEKALEINKKLKAHRFF